MDCAINAPGHVNNVVDGLNTTDKRYLKGKMELIGKLASDDSTNIGMLPSDSKYVSIKFSDQCLHIINNNNKLNGLKGSVLKPPDVCPSTGPSVPRPSLRLK